MEPVEEEFGVVNIREDYGIIHGPNTTTTYCTGMGGRNVNPYVENDYSEITN